MKIVDVCAFYAPNGGGVRTYVDRKLAAGPAAGHEIVVVAPGTSDWTERRSDGASIRWLRSPRFPLDSNYRYFADRRQLHDVLDQERPDVVEASSPWRSASMVADWQGDAVRVMIAHADPLSAYAYRWFGGIAERPTIDRAFDWYWRHLKRLNVRFDHIVSASESMSQRLRGGGLVNIVTNPMGVEQGVFSPRLRDLELRRRMLARCGLDENATLLLGVGRHAPEKRWEMICEAATVAGGTCSVALLLVGAGRDSGRLRRAVGQNPHIQLMAPVTDRVELARLMASSDALIHGCEAETFCFVAAEARASGLPLIVPDMGGASDQAALGQSQTYISGSASSAASAIIRTIADASRARRGTASPVRSMEDHFADLFELYERAILPQTRLQRRQ